MTYKFVLYSMPDSTYPFKHFLFAKKYQLSYFWSLSLWDKIKKNIVFQYFPISSLNFLKNTTEFIQNI